MPDTTTSSRLEFEDVIPAYPEWCFRRLRSPILAGTLVTIGLSAAFAARDWLVAPDVAWELSVFRFLGMGAAFATYAGVKRSSTWSHAHASVFIGIILFLFTTYAVLTRLPNGFRYGMVTTMLIPLVSGVLMTRMREVLVVQAAAFLTVQLVYLHAHPEPIEWAAAEATLVTMTAVTSFVGWLSCRARAEQYRLEQLLREQASRDALTGLANRRQLLVRSTVEVARSRRYQSPVSVVLLDIDHFKRINDSRGHPFGDAVIQATASVLTSALRETDLAARVGGEEFVLLLPETSHDAAKMLADRVRLQIAAARVPGDDDQLIFTVSAGVATLSDDDRDIDDVLKRADEGLYAAKRLGRNAVASIRPTS